MEDVYMHSLALHKEGSSRYGDIDKVMEALKLYLDRLEMDIENYNKGWVKSGRDEILADATEMQLLLWELLAQMKVCPNSLVDMLYWKIISKKKKT